MESRILVSMLLALTLSACGSRGGNGDETPPTNAAPTITSSSFEVTQNTEFSGTLTATDPEGDAVSFRKTADPGKGQLVMLSAQGTFTYRPNEGFFGTDSFSVSASDGAHDVSASITLNVKAVQGPAPQELTFEQTGPLSLFVQDSLMNPASGPGSGAVSYSSSAPEVASVDENGAITIQGAGHAQIRAIKAADANYLAAQASYEIYSVDRRVPFSAWVGAAQTEVKFAPSAAGLAFYRSSQPECDLANYSSCEHGQLDLLGSEPVIDTAATLGRAGHYALEHGDQVATAQLGTDSTFAPVHSHQVVLFRDQLWLIGGSNDQLRNDVWSSRDGITWIRQPARNATPGEELFTPRKYPQVVVFGGQLWLIGGNDGQYRNDVWSSPDGIEWTRRDAVNAVAGQPLFTPRDGHQVAVFDGKLWLIGGYDDQYRNDVWSSPDGIHWTEQEVTGPQPGQDGFTPRSSHQVAVFDGKLWLIGGDSKGLRNDVWSSPDGIRWTAHEAVNTRPDEGLFAPRVFHSLVVFNGKLWLIGGKDSGSKRNDVWSSPNGIEWTEETKDHPSGERFSPRTQHQAVAFDGQLWLIGGRDDRYRNDVWSSANGSDWTQQSATADFTGRLGHPIVEFNGQLWLIGGFDGQYRNDVWSSPDGFTWVRQPARNATPGEDLFTPRKYHQIVVFGGQLWLIGGFDGQYRNDVWSSPDGVEWTQRNAVNAQAGQALFTPRQGHQVAVLDGKLWLIGGFDGADRNDVWSSPDGIQWTRQDAVNTQSDEDLFTPRQGHQVAVFDGKLWLIGGHDVQYSNEVWSSPDGIQWTRQDAVNTQSDEDLFTPRQGHQVVVFDGKLWLIGGYDGDFRNDVWFSPNGIEWTEETKDHSSWERFSPRVDHAVVPFQGRLWLMGGNAGEVLSNDIWRCADGTDWRMQLHGEFNFDSR